MCVRFGGYDATRVQDLAMENATLWELQSRVPLLYFTQWRYSCTNSSGVCCHQFSLRHRYILSLGCSHHRNQQTVYTQQPRTPSETTRDQTAYNHTRLIDYTQLSVLQNTGETGEKKLFVSQMGHHAGRSPFGCMCVCCTCAVGTVCFRHIIFFFSCSKPTHRAPLSSP